MEIKIVMKYCTKPFKSGEVPCNLFISVDQFCEALRIFICNLRQDIVSEDIKIGPRETRLPATITLSAPS